MKYTKIITAASLTALSLAACGPQPLPFAGAPRGPIQAQNFQRFNAGPDAGVKVVPGQMIVKYRQGGMSAQGASALAQMGAQRLHPVGSPASGMEVVQLPSGQSAAAAAAQLSQNPAIEYAEPVFTFPYPQVFADEAPAPTPPASFPNDPMFSRQWAHKITDSQGGWAVTKGDKKVIIGIVDSGVDINHPDLKGKIVDTFNGADNNKDVEDVVGHGTHVAGIAAAMTNNGTGVAGVAPDCGILAVKVSSGKSSFPSTAGIANGIIWAADHGADVINLSLGSSRQSRAITDAVKHAISKDVVVIAATGNDGRRTKSYPAATDGVIAVGSTTSRDGLSSFSNYGKHVSVAAPGSNILSTFPLNDNLIKQKEYGSISGTSMATPFVTGLAALILSQHPNLDSQAVRQALESSADDKGDPGWDEKFGHGRVNVANALSAAAQISGAPGAAPVHMQRMAFRRR